MIKQYKLCVYILSLTIAIIGCTNKNINNATNVDTVINGSENTSVTPIEDIMYISADSGFYDDEFDLELRAYGDLDIYYTLDGTAPSQSSIKYTNPIHIVDATDNPNVYSMRTDISGGYEGVEDGFEQGTFFKYYVPDYNVDKCTIIRIAAYDSTGKQVAYTNRTYFVGADIKTKYDGISVVSLVTDPKNLFDYDTGIYVRGKYEEENSQGIDPDFLKEHWYWTKGNYNNDGRDWEREADIDYFNADKQLVLSSPCGIRIQGNGSRDFAQKSFNVYARKEYGGKRTFKADIFGDGYNPHKFTIFAGSADPITKMRDTLMATSCSGLAYATLQFIPCALFLDGEYWGMYYVSEKYDKDFIAHKYDVDKDNVVMIKDASIEEGNEEDYALYTEMMDFFGSCDLSIEENYKKACELIDIDSYIDYFATMIYIARRDDWPNANIALWRVREKGDGKYEDGRFRYMLFDLNSPCLDDSGREVTLLTMVARQSLPCLIANDEFKYKFIGKLCTLGNTILGKEAAYSFIDEYMNDYLDQLMNSHRRYYGTYVNEDKVVDHINGVRYFFHNRFDRMLDLTNEVYMLDANKVMLTIKTDDIDKGFVNIDRCLIDLTQGTWEGRYLEGVCLTINALPADGHKVIGIKIGDKIIETDSYEFYINNDTELEIIFE